MSYYAELDNAEKTGGDVATLHGWAMFCQWVDSLTADLPQIRQLTLYGWCQNLPALETDLTEAIETGADADNASVANGLLAMLKMRGDAEVIAVTDGVGVKPDEDHAESPSATAPEQNNFAETPTLLALIEAEAIVADTLKRMERIEANEITRAAKEPRTFLDRIDAFYLAHRERMREALERPVRTVVLLRDGEQAGGLNAEIEIDQTINEHVAGKRESLLTAAECQPPELPARVAEVIESWK